MSLLFSTLSKESGNRLLSLFPPSLPVVDADDAAALEDHAGQEEEVVS